LNEAFLGLLPASWHEWRRNGRHVAYYGGTEEDIVRTFSRLLDEVEHDDHGAFRVARAFGHHQEVNGQLVNPVQPQSGEWKAARVSSFAWTLISESCFLFSS